jgi:protein-disulfide isomerase
MVVSRTFVRIGIGAVLVLLNIGTALGQKETGVVAEVGGVNVTLADLQQEEAGKLLQAQYQYYLAESKALDDLVDRRLLEQKAKKEGLSVEQLLQRDITSQIKEPTEDQVKVYYEGLETDQPYEAVRSKILEKIRQVRTDKARTAYMKALHEETNVIVELAPPSADVNTENAFVLGSKNAPVTLVEFADYECPYCQKVAPDITRLSAEFGSKLSVVFKDFPLPMHAHAAKAAEAALCAGEQGKFWEYHDMIFRSKQLEVEQLKGQATTLGLDATRFNKCLDSGAEAAAVQQSRAQGTNLGLSGTPSFFVNGHFYSGALDFNALHEIIARQLSSQQSQQVAMVSSK